MITNNDILIADIKAVRYISEIRSEGMEVMVRKKFLMILVLGSMFLLVPSEVVAHPGRTDSNGCHYCRTNCAKWGLRTGEYHCHNSGSSSSSSSSGSNSESANSQNITPQVPVKSSDNTLKSITVDDSQMTISDNMQYKTFNEKVNIVVEPNDSKATYVIDNKTLELGNNSIVITVTAENGDVKYYNLTIIREALSNNTNIQVFIGEEEVEFIDGKASLDVSETTDEIAYTYQLEDPNAKVETTGDNKLQVGENLFTFKVTAQDGTEKTYELIINKPKKAGDMISTIIGLAMVAGIGYGIYHNRKKSNVKQKEKSD